MNKDQNCKLEEIICALAVITVAGLINLVFKDFPSLSDRSMIRDAFVEALINIDFGSENKNTKVN